MGFSTILLERTGRQLVTGFSFKIIDELRGRSDNSFLSLSLQLIKLQVPRVMLCNVCAPALLDGRHDCRLGTLPSQYWQRKSNNFQDRTFLGQFVWH